MSRRWGGWAAFAVALFYWTAAGAQSAEPEGAATEPEGVATEPEGAATEPEGAATEPEGVADELSDVAELFIERGEHDKAIEVFRELRRARPADVELLDRLIDLCRRSTACAPGLEPLIREAMALSPGRPDLLERLYELLLEAGRPEVAVAEVERHLSRWPKSPRVRQLLADAPYDLVAALALTGRDREAPKLLRDLVARHPDLATARELLADLLAEHRDLAGAIAVLRAGLVRAPRRWSARDRLVDLLVEQGQPRAALAAVRAGLALDSRRLPLRLVEVDLLTSLGEARAAAAAVSALLRDLPGHARTWVLAGEQALERDDHDGARRAIRRARGLHRDAEDAERLRHLERDLARARAERRADFRKQTRWMDLGDELARSRYP